MEIAVKRIYEPADAGDGRRVLVDRLWPRGIAKDKAACDEWAKDIAPSNELRKTFHHDPARWEEFRERYWQELDENPEAVDSLLSAARAGRVTLLYAAKDEERNNAIALRDYLLRRAARGR